MRLGRFPLVATMIVTAAVSTGCFTTATDFQDDAEKFIVSDEDFAAAFDVTFVTATCEEPLDQATGTRFTCVARDDAGGDWEFDAEITGSSSYEIVDNRRPAP